MTLSTTFDSFTENAWQMEHSKEPVPEDGLYAVSEPCVVDYVQSRICADMGITAMHPGLPKLQSKEQTVSVVQEILSRARI